MRTLDQIYDECVYLYRVAKSPSEAKEVIKKIIQDYVDQEIEKARRLEQWRAVTLDSFRAKDVKGQLGVFKNITPPNQNLSEDAYKKSKE